MFVSADGPMNSAKSMWAKNDQNRKIRSRITPIQGSWRSFSRKTTLAISDVSGDDIAVIGSGIGTAPLARGFDWTGRIVASNAIARDAVASAAAPDGIFANVVSLGSQLFASALLLGLPTLTAILMINVAFGVITRAAPQLNIFAVGFPVTIVAGFLFMFLALPAFIAALQRFLSLGLEQTLLVLG